MMKKLLALVLAAALLVTLFAACGGDNGSSTSSQESSSSTAESSSEATSSEETSSTAEESSEESKVEDNQITASDDNTITYPLASHPTLSWWWEVQAASYQSNNDSNELWNKIAEEAGVDIEWVHPSSGNAQEQLNLLLVSGDLPDILQINGLLDTAGGSSAGVADGSFVDLTDHLAEWSPDYVKAITNSNLAYSMATTAENRVTEYDQIKQTAPQYNRVNVRNDIMEEIGWKDRLPETIDDYTEMFKAMKEKNYYGYRTASNGRDSQLMFPYGIYPGFYLNEENKVAYGMWSDNYREYLKQVKEWIDAGYVHPDWTSDVDTAALFSSKEIGMYITPSDISYGLAKATGYEITCVNYPRLKAGDKFRFETTTWDPVPADGIRTVISTNCEEKGKLQDAMNFLNFGYTEKGSEFYNWGIEGKAYTRNADGTKTFTDLILNNPDGIPASEGQYIFKLHFGPKLAEADVQCNPGTIGDPKLAEADVQCNPGTIGDPKALFWREEYSDDPTVSSDAIIFASLTVDQSTARAEYMTDIETYMNENTQNFLLGQLDINDDAAWQTYMDTMQSMGIEEAIKITQEAVDNFNSKKIPTDWAFH